MGCSSGYIALHPSVSASVSKSDCVLLVVEHYRNLWNFVRVLHEKEEDGSNICNNTTCPRMSAGASVTVSTPSGC